MFDLNQDGKVDNVDIAILTERYYGRSVDYFDPVMVSLDLNNDGIINALDYSLLLARLREAQMLVWQPTPKELVLTPEEVQLQLKGPEPVVVEETAPIMKVSLIVLAILVLLIFGRRRK